MYKLKPLGINAVPATSLFSEESHSVEFCIQGKNINPCAVPLARLLEALRYANGAIKAVGAKGTENGLSLVDVGKGSVRCELSVNEVALNAITRLTGIIASGEMAQLPPKAKSNVQKLWNLAVENNWDGYEFRSNGGNLATISSEEDPLSVGVFKGVTTIYGRCIRAGGESPSVQLKLLNESTVYATLKSKGMAQELGNRLYETIGLEGVATWSKSNKLVDFEAEKIAPFHDRDTGHASARTIMESFEELAKSSGDRWNETGSEFVKELRDD